jgi:hypothetical protein
MTTAHHDTFLVQKATRLFSFLTKKKKVEWLIRDEKREAAF